MSVDVREGRGAATTMRSHATDTRAASPTVAARVLEGVRLLLVAVWLGGAVFFSFVVAPTAFAVLPTRELAGAVVTRTIAVVNVGGFVVGLLLLATAFFGKGDDTRRSAARLIEVASLAIIAIACGVGHWIVAARMVALRASMGRPTDAVAANDPARVVFNSLHGYSVALMCAGVLAGVVALFAISRHRDV